MTEQTDKPVRAERKRRDDGPKMSLTQELEVRIKGLTLAKTEPGHSPQDLAALDRSIAKLNEKLDYLNTPKPATTE